MLDIFLAFFAICLFLPFIFLIYLIIYLENKSPIYRQIRVGKNMNKFTLIKFRTMSIGTKSCATHLVDNSKITKIGKVLRKSKLDELPQLWSIFTGKMSFVGPRPALYNQFDLIKLREKNDIHLLKPGITGWAQINGRDDLSINKKVEIEIYYKKNINLLLDIKILFLTILKVFRMHDIKH